MTGTAGSTLYPLAFKSWSSPARMNSLGWTFGACLEGAVVSIVLYGVACGQLIRYYRCFPNDTTFLKCLVGATFAIDSFHQILVIHIIWHYLITKCGGDPALCVYGNWSLIAQTIPAELDFILVRFFYITRIWNFNKGRVAFVMIIPAVLSFAFSIAFSGLFGRFNSLVSFNGPGPKNEILEIVLCLSSVCTIIVDACITVSMCYLLYRASKGVSRRSRSLRSVVGSTINYTVVTGLLANIVACIFLVSFFALRGSMAFLALYFVGAKVFVNSMLAALNSREGFRARLEIVHDLDLVTGGVDGPAECEPNTDNS